MRSYKEIQDDINHALSIDDAPLLFSLAEEMEALGTKEAAAAAANGKGTAYRLTSDYTQAMHVFEEGLALREELGDSNGVATITSNMALVFSETGKFSEAIKLYEQARSFYQTQGDALGTATCTYNIGNVYLNIGDFSKTLELNLQALASFVELGEHICTAHVYANIGIVYGNMGNFPLSLENFERALALYEKMDYATGAANTIGNIGLVYSETGNYPSALEQYEKQLTLCEDLGFRQGVASANCCIGGVYLNTGDYPRALDHYEKGLAIYEALGEPVNVTITIGQIGNVYHKMKDFTNALEWYQNALLTCKSIGLTGTMVSVTTKMALVYEDAERWSEARTMLADLDAMTIEVPSSEIERHHIRARLLEHDGDLVGAETEYTQALEIAEGHSLRAASTELHMGLRDLAKKRGNLDDYIRHNDEFQRINEEIRGKNATQKLAIMEAEKRIAKERKSEREERQREQATLYSTLPKHIADRVSGGEKINDHYDNSAVIFIDVVGFTTLSSELTSSQTVDMLETLFTTLDGVCKKHGVVKIKTIGDSYLGVGF